MAALAVISTPPVSTVVDGETGRSDPRRANTGEDLRRRSLKQAPPKVNAPGPIPKRGSLLPHAAASERSADVLSEWRQSVSSESNHRVTIYLDARDESASEVSIEDSTERDVTST